MQLHLVQQSSAEVLLGDRGAIADCDVVGAGGLTRLGEGALDPVVHVGERRRLLEQFGRPLCDKALRSHCDELTLVVADSSLGPAHLRDIWLRRQLDVTQGPTNPLTRLSPRAMFNLSVN
jgi:hypothetical protein